MALLLVACLFVMVLGLAAVASNPSPYFGALGLVVVAGMGCGVLVGYGGSFLSLVLFLIYLGGMLVVFAYSAALAAEPYPEGLGSWPVAALMLFYLAVNAVLAGLFWSWGYDESWFDVDEFLDQLLRPDVAGAAMLYSTGGGLLIMGGWGLLQTLFVVLELTRGLCRGALRAV